MRKRLNPRAPTPAAKNTLDHRTGSRRLKQRTPSAIAKSDEDFAARAHCAQYVLIVLIADRAFDNAHIHLRDFLHVGDRAGGELDKPGQVNQPLIQIEKRHMAAGTAPQPGGCHFYFWFIAHANTVSKIVLPSRASPWRGKAARKGSVRPSKFVTEPFFSYHAADGRTTLAMSVNAES